MTQFPVSHAEKGSERERRARETQRKERGFEQPNGDPGPLESYEMLLDPSERGSCMDLLMNLNYCSEKVQRTTRKKKGKGEAREE